MLAYKSYVSKCVLGAEVIYVFCLVGGLLPWRSLRGIELHHALFETLPGFTWLTLGSVIWGAVMLAVFAIVFGAYMVWMHNSSLVK
ncbi:MAG: hypothetical protein A3D52_02520 [Candidatus Taylorbacteria bacterium RIFCSPHIGHO2_02_FULL_44_36]|uniref:Uncharacterized protein n=1 Tax=Candidatus Taylorbacteria bacterium RIFCSPLOWO2_12_FULL_44_15c TaxID=1802333 RepID=A0A1G2P787_9BACT|nr:MAG: hypothetical protein A3D52_02520 [Candidatus Taylorbacteria bacterium RIFCSPHIGHO2_02_FULL_44_36]OHA38048.1 MAG: hypothetical protein A3I97_03075 [Candidatus Taylorbacteria bacterium RIFCSPLOWO2_02_FULL_44_35]OHA43431.1 MAG: hypothetical protein A3G03_01290 [Candidatus Taylorbacteria bacterium RIFCSPLOWO2_12_FULL_44_15c]